MEGAHQSFRTWRPLLEGEDRARALAAVEGIADALAALPLDAGTGIPVEPTARTPSSLGSGHAGYALFFASLEQHRPGEGFAERAIAHLDLAIELLASEESLAGLYSGFTGVAWTVERVQGLLGLDPDDELNTEIDDALSEHLGQSPWLRQYDLVSGLVGYAVYALARLPRPVAAQCLESVVDRLAELAEELPPGLAWHTPAEHLMPDTRAEYPGGYHSLGVAHGVPGVVAVLAQICAAGIARDRARPLLDGAVRWMLAQKLEPRSDSVFPVAVAAGVAPRASRAAWCYGDPGIAAALLVAARSAGEPGWEREAVEMARAGAVRPPSTAGINDACLCHGAAGLGHLLNGVYQATSDERCREGARLWFRQALEMQRPGEGFAGFLAWDSGARDALELIGVPGFLTGATGVGLALLAASTSFDPCWDEVLLVLPVGRNSVLATKGA
jgi:lantibiotic modifying enzyme